MNEPSLEERLSRIPTLWTLVQKAHHAPSDAARAARGQLLERYGGAVRRYLGGVLRDSDAADDLYQEFACQVLQGDLGGADPERGRFRHYVKGVLFHLAAGHHRRQRRQPGRLPDHVAEPAVDPPSLADLDQAFVQHWRDELLASAWRMLADEERATGKPFHTVLRFRAEHPDLSSGQMAEQLRVRLGKPLTAAGVRQTLHRARERFADRLVDEVWHSLAEPTVARLEEELIDLGLWEYCQPALARRDS